jgi:hypothetical protein
MMDRAQSARIGELAQMPKSRLLEIMTEQAKRHGATWVIGGPALWSRDELIDGIMEFERAATCLASEELANQ